MATKKSKAKKGGRPSKGERVPILFRVDVEILESLDAYRAVTKEERSPCLQRLAMEHLMAKGFYPLKR